MSRSKKSETAASATPQITFPVNTTEDPEWLIDDILPAHEIHLIVGPDGERGKRSTFTIQMIADWAQGKQVFNGFASHPVPFVYICYGRTPGATRRAIKNLRIGVNFKTAFLTGAEAKDLTNVVMRAQQVEPEVRLIILDSISALCPGGRDNRIAAEMLNRLQDLCTHCGITILGVASYPKAKAGEQYPNVRDRISGGGAFSQFAETVIAIEAMEHHVSLNYGITVSVGSIEEEESFAFHWEAPLHRLVPGFIEVPVEIKWHQVMDEWLDEFDAGEIITTEDIYGAAKERTDAKRTSLFAWIESKRDEGRIMSQMRGKYVVTRKN
jgi:hypothetical protein